MAHPLTVGQNTKNQPITMGDITDLTGRRGEERTRGDRGGGGRTDEKRKENKRGEERG